MRDYTKIEAWRLADDLTVAVYELTRVFPREELYGLTSQLRRAAASVAANIAEGSSRGTKKDYLHFLYMARGSLAESRYFLHLSTRLGYAGGESAEYVREQAARAFACLQGLIRAVEKEAVRAAQTLAIGCIVLPFSGMTFPLTCPGSLVLGP